MAGFALLAAENFAVLVDLHVCLKGGRVRLFTGKRLAKVLGKVLDFLRGAEGQLVEVEDERRLRGH